LKKSSAENTNAKKMSRERLPVYGDAMGYADIMDAGTDDDVANHGENAGNEAAATTDVDHNRQKTSPELLRAGEVEWKQLPKSQMVSNQGPML
jgi:hypothetical protein